MAGVAMSSVPHSQPSLHCLCTLEGNICNSRTILLLVIAEKQDTNQALTVLKGELIVANSMGAGSVFKGYTVCMYYEI